MPLSRDETIALIDKLQPLVRWENEPPSQYRIQVLSAEPVFDLVRELCVPPITEEEVNVSADKCEAKRTKEEVP